jgi:glycosyltransferase involved in cell wall biosynthesis
MNQLTVIILSRNEEDVIGDAIASVKGFAKEILVVDGFSSDSTQKIALKAGATVLKHPFSDFSDQRNFGMDHATNPWVLYIDADERVTPAFKKEVESILNTTNLEDEYAGFFIKRKTFFYGKDWGMTDRVQRLFIRKRFDSWKGLVHETPTIKGKFSQINSPILHFTHRNLSQMVNKTNEWSEYEARLRLLANHPPLVPWRFVRVMFTEFINSYIRNKGYKNGTYGLIEAVYQAFSIFITYAKLWEIQERNNKV